MKLSFQGAAQQVTGSCHLLEAGGLSILIDCGLFQGARESDEENADAFGFEPSKIDILLLTHAHLDHCGRIPLLVKRGFKGEIIATSATRELARLVLLDAAHIQEEDARHRARHIRRQGQKPTPPLYDIPDALRAMDFFRRRADYNKPIRLSRSVTVRFIDAGHILGSASLVVDVSEGDKSRRIVFSGDIGNGGRPILPDPTPPPAADYVVMESTYGDRQHRDFSASADELIGAVNDTLGRGGNVIIPTFALERAQEILYVLADGIDQGVLPAALPVFLDSPMAVSATEIFARYPAAFHPAFRRIIGSGRDPFGMPGLRFIRETAESIEINRINGGAVIMAGSGMCTGGRVVHHLRHNLWRRDCGVVFVGYAASGTLARRIIDGAKTVRIYGETVAVKARVHTINGFSAHADCDELLAWQHHAGKPRMTFLVHGDEDRGMADFQHKLAERGVRSTCPEPHQTVTLR